MTRVPNMTSFVIKKENNGNFTVFVKSLPSVSHSITFISQGYSKHSFSRGWMNHIFAVFGLNRIPFPSSSRTVTHPSSPPPPPSFTPVPSTDLFVSQLIFCYKRSIYFSIFFIGTISPEDDIFFIFAHHLFMVDVINALKSR